MAMRGLLVLLFLGIQCGYCDAQVTIFHPPSDPPIPPGVNCTFPSIFKTTDTGHASPYPQGMCEEQCLAYQKLHAAPTSIDVHVDEPANLTIDTDHALGGANQCVGSGGSVDWGDNTRPKPVFDMVDDKDDHGNSHNCLKEPIVAKKISHPYEQVGSYCASVYLHGDFTYSSSHGSCSYTCTLARNVLVHVLPK